MSDSTLGAIEALRERADAIREDARRVARFNQHDAEIIEAVVEDLEGALMEAAPEWVPIEDVQRWTGWKTREKLYAFAHELAKRGDARKDEAGRWEFRREAALELPRKPIRDRSAQTPEEISDLVAAGEY